jgi:archaellum component FlaC
MYHPVNPDAQVRASPKERRIPMAMPDEIVRKEVYDGWKTFLENLESAVSGLEKEVENTSKMLNACTLEWCQATEHALDEVANALFSIAEPALSTDEDSKRLKALKRRVHDVYAHYKATAEKAS